MTRSRKDAPARATSKAAPSRRARWLAFGPDSAAWRPGRLATRAVIACVTVGILATFASWSASGFLAPGGLDRLVAMKNTPEPARVADGKRGGLDRGRLKSVIAGSAGAP